MSTAVHGEEWREGLVQLGPDWLMGPDGVPVRSAARVLLLDEHDRLLLARGHDVDDPGRHWWFTVGGGIDAGESPHQAAVREVAEETGLRLEVEQLVGPVLRRTALFDFARRTVRQHEVFFLARVDRPEQVVRDGWTTIEQGFMDEVRWWSLPELALEPEQVYPDGLATLVAGLLQGWDGRLVELPEQP